MGCRVQIGPAILAGDPAAQNGQQSAKPRAGVLPSPPPHGYEFAPSKANAHLPLLCSQKIAQRKP
jgi:hypothetical protein